MTHWPGLRCAFLQDRRVSVCLSTIGPLASTAPCVPTGPSVWVAQASSSASPCVARATSAAPLPWAPSSRAAYAVVCLSPRQRPPACRPRFRRRPPSHAALRSRARLISACGSASTGTLSPEVRTRMAVGPAGHESKTWSPCFLCLEKKIKVIQKVQDKAHSFLDPQYMERIAFKKYRPFRGGHFATSTCGVGLTCKVQRQCLGDSSQLAPWEDTAD
jgi:hypothetical protein